MKKITPYILIFFIFVNLFAPLSLELSDNKIAIEKNKTEAVDAIKLKGFITRNDTSITVYAAVNFENDSWRTSNEKVVIILSDSDKKVITLQGPNNTVVNATEMEEHPILDATKELLPTEVKTAISDTTTTKFYKKVITGLKPNTTYLVSMYATHTVVSWWTMAATGVGVATIILSAGVGTPLVIAAGTAIAGGAAVVAGETIRITNDDNTLVMDPPVSITTNPAGVTQNITANASVTATNKDPSALPACDILKTPLGCVAQAIYYVLFQPTSYLFALSGTLFDNAFAYSVDDNSYRSPFVVEGWKIVRDFCNMFFIFILLYIAFGTILNLNGVKTKEMIINVVLIGIFINFSLFASQVIIDASNILARVFYNSNTITVKINDASVGSTVIPLSAALVNKINPQQIILSASQVNTVQDTRGKAGGAADTNTDAATSINTGTFILVTLLATIVNVVGIFVFFSISIIFIARVIGLWLAMILVPFAFLSYTVPAMQDFEMVGWKRWWPETLKLAFLAPIFIFFLYLILQFIETGFMIVQNDANPVGLTLMIGIILPFVFIMILLLKAKSIATTMSGKIGETITKAGATVGGMVVGGAGVLAMGALAGVGRQTFGKLGEKVANSDWVKTHGAVGRGMQDLGKWTAGKSFDVRATKLGAAAGKGMGVDLGKAKEGGYVKHKADVEKKRRERAESQKLGAQTPQVQELHHAEEELSNLKNERVNDTNRIDGILAAKRLVGNDLYQKLTAANAELAKNKKDPEAIKKAADAQKDFNDNSGEIDKLTKERNDLNGSTGKYSHRTGDGKVNKKGFDDYKTNVVDKSEIDTKDTIAKANADMLKATTDEQKAEFQKIIDDATKENNDIKKIFEEMETAVKANGFAEEGKTHSINELGLKMIPELHHTVEKENADRVNKYAKVIRGRFFNGDANDKAAHEAIMKSEIKKS